MEERVGGREEEEEEHIFCTNKKKTKQGSSACISKLRTSFNAIRKGGPVAEMI